MELSSPSSSSSSPQSAVISAVDSVPASSNPTVGNEPLQNPSEASKSAANGERVGRRKKRRRISKPVVVPSTSYAYNSSTQQRGQRVGGSSRGGGRRRDLDSLALPLGMSIAAFVAQVLDKKIIEDERMSTDRLSLICTSAVKESLANVFGDKFDRFVRNFGESFGCTLKTLRLVNDASLINGELLGRLGIENIYSEVSKSAYLDVPRHSQDSSVSNSSVNRESEPLEEHEKRSSIRASKSSSISVPTISEIYKSLDCTEEITDNINMRPDSMNLEVALHGEVNRQLSFVAPRKLGSGVNGSMLKAFEKSVVERTRSNDLKEFEIGLKMRELKLKETELALSSDSNHLDRCKLSMGISKASFRAEKFKTELEETRHAELLKKCIDCLVAGLLIMCASIIYGAYVFAYKRILEVTTSCTSHKESKSWWMPKQAASVSSGVQWLICQVTVSSRILFGVLMIVAIAYLLLQRSSTSKQLMPVTHIVLLLGLMCGITGKLCVDTLGGSGYTWFLYWEALCLLHFLSNVCTSMFYTVLHGSVSVTQGFEPKARVPYWVRRLVFYGFILVVLPLLCGLMPFAGPLDWKDHLVSVLFASAHLEGS